MEGSSLPSKECSVFCKVKTKGILRICVKRTLNLCGGVGLLLGMAFGFSLQIQGVRPHDPEVHGELLRLREEILKATAEESDIPTWVEQWILDQGTAAQQEWICCKSGKRSLRIK